MAVLRLDEGRNCDIVMKGGITSGIVYPAAVCEIAKAFRFKNVGGTSAGAIAAALTAAAERRRCRDGSEAGFEQLGTVPDWLAEDSRLFRLFTPSASTRSLFRTVASLFGRPRFKPALVAKWCGLVWAYPIASAVGAVPGLGFVWAIIDAAPPGWRLAGGVALAAATIVAGMTLGVTLAFGRDALRRISANFYGLVTGIDERDPKNAIALSVWLEQQLEEIAGVTAATPLTFGMLWDAQRDPALAWPDELPPELSEDPDVNLEMITTNVTWGRPFRFPLDTKRFSFVPNAFLAFFPEHVVRWMIARSADPASRAVPVDHEKAIAFPRIVDLPVVVATRMSLAFPILLSAVPVYALDEGSGKMQLCWFSDGGISSNFPITLFDGPLPRWPTFGIDLSGLPDGRALSENESENVSMPADNKQPFPTWNLIRSLPGFLSGILDAMQNWNDNTQCVLPGYRDRIVTVYLAPDEGGLNLDMPPAILHRLRARGAAAGKELVARFAAPSVLESPPDAMDWENHRWLRYRSTMAALRTYLSAFDTALQQPMKPDVSYFDLARAEAGLPTVQYPLAADARRDVVAVTEGLQVTAGTISGLRTLGDQIPEPPPLLDLRPHVDV